MIINSSKVKSEAILLFCRDLIDSYNSKDDVAFELDNKLIEFINIRTTQLLKALNTTVQPIDYYIRNTQVSRINLIVKSYVFIEKQISKELKQGSVFNPFMLCFALLSTWFAELQKCNSDQEFIYYSIYPYSEIFDNLVVKNCNSEYKNMSISMINIAEKTIFKLDSYKFK